MSRQIAVFRVILVNVELFVRFFVKELLAKRIMNFVVLAFCKEKMLQKFIYNFLQLAVQLCAQFKSLNATNTHDLLKIADFPQATKYFGNFSQKRKSVSFNRRY